MATYTSLGRTNYFACEIDELENLLRGSGIALERDSDGERAVLLDTEGADWVIYRDDEDDEGVWLPDVIAEYLKPGEIAVFQTIGHEKLRVLNGQAVAVNHTGQQVHVGIDDIYSAAAEAFGIPSTAISRATY